VTDAWSPSYRLYPIIDTDVCAARGVSPLDVAAACLAGGARLLQLRAKHLAGRDVLSLADRLVALAAPDGGRIIVNDRPDIARASRAAGVHVGQNDLPPAEARAVLGTGLLGLSTHDEPQVDGVPLPLVDYIAVGPVYGTSTKETGYTPRGLPLVRYAVRIGTPVVAIGGITLERTPEVLAAGASAVAVISDLFATGDVAARVRGYLAATRG